MLDHTAGDRNPVRTVAGYGLMVAAAVGLFFAIRFYGETLTAPAPAVVEAAGNNATPAMASGWLIHLLMRWRP